MGVEFTDEIDSPTTKQLQNMGMVVLAPESPEDMKSRIEQEEVFKLEREAKEKIIHDIIALKLQAHYRGYDTRRKVASMRKAVKGLSLKIYDIKNKQRCRRIVKKLILERKESSIKVQKIVRGFLGGIRTDRVRRRRMEFLVEEVEKAFRITEIVGMNCPNRSFFNVDDEEVDIFKSEYGYKDEMKWLKIFPEHAKPSYGCDLFKGVEERGEGEKMHVGIVGEGVFLKL